MKFSIDQEVTAEVLEQLPSFDWIVRVGIPKEDGSLELQGFRLKNEAVTNYRRKVLEGMRDGRLPAGRVIRATEYEIAVEIGGPVIGIEIDAATEKSKAFTSTPPQSSEKS